MSSTAIVSMFDYENPDGYDLLHSLRTKSLVDYCRANNYSLIDHSRVARHLSSLPPFCDTARPASWLKIPVILQAMKSFDFVAWIDADVFVVPEAPRIPENINDYAMVCHDVGSNMVPNCGVWFIRNTLIMRDYLIRCWSMTQHVHSGWWEQTAWLDMMGWPIRKDWIACVNRQNDLVGRCYWLDPRWNLVPTHANWQEDYGWFLHASGMPMSDRVRFFTEWSKKYDRIRRS